MQLTSLSLALTRAGFLSFSPASLFANGEVGAWYDPSSMDTLFTDSAGTTPVTAVEQPVGLMLDKSNGLVLGSELVVNGDFSGGTTGWTLQPGVSVSGGQAVFDGVTSFAPNATMFETTNNISIVPGRSYQVTWTLTANSTSPVAPVLGGAAGTERISAGTYTNLIVAGAGTKLAFVARFNSGARTGGVDNISVRELPGNHATQSTSASRPVLSARVNLLTKTEQFDDAAWNKTNAQVTANTTVAPDGTLTADLVYPTATGSAAIVAQSQTVFADVATYKATVRVKPAGFDWIVFAVRNAGGTRYVWQWFNLNTGTVGGFSRSAWNRVSASISPQDAYGFFECSVVITSTQAESGVGIFAGPTDADSSLAITKNGTSGIYIWGADLRVANDGVGLPAYQRVNTSTDYDTTGFPMYLRFDGVDDGMVTNSINFTSTDKMTVFAGVRVQALSGMIAELSAAQNAGTFYLFSAGNSTIEWGRRANGAPTNTQTATVPVPKTSVLAWGVDFAAAPEVTSQRVDGISSGSVGSADTGTGNFGNYPLSIGRRNNASLPFNGRLYSLIVRGAQSTAGQITQTETFVNGKTRAFA